MLKKSKIAMAVTAATFGALGVANTAQAVYLSDDRTGQVSILPYYNVNNNFVTQISITNTTNLSKVVKVRFRESSNSQDVLDFNIYMSPFDQWTASVRPNNENGLANLVTVDESCTYPRNSRFKGDGQNFIELYDNVEAADVTEGYVEIYEVGVIADGPGPAVDNNLYAVVSPTFTNTQTPVAGTTRVIVDAIDHNLGVDGVPPDCDAVIDAWGPLNQGFTKGALIGGIAADDQVIVDLPYTFGPDPFPRIPALNDGLVAPTGGIAVYSILINAATGAAFVQEATAIHDYSTLPQHYRSDDQVNYLLPSLSSGNNFLSSWLDGTGLGTTVFGWPLTYFDTGSVIDVSPNNPVPMGANPFPVAAVLSVVGIANDFFVDPAISGSTDWVVTFPMRKHGIYNGATLVDDLDGTGTATACVPGTLALSADTTVDLWTATAAVGGALCNNAGYVDNLEDDVIVAVRYWDNEEAEVIPDPDDPIVSPPFQDNPEAFVLPREVNVITFARENESPDSVLGSPAARVFNVRTGWIVGWAQAVMDPRYNYGTNPNIDALVDPNFGLPVPPANPVAIDLFGVPTLGFAALEGLFGPASVGETVQYILSLDRRIP